MGQHTLGWFWIPCTEFSISCQWNLDSGFQSLAGLLISCAGFRIPKPRIPDITNKNFRDYGFGLPYLGHFRSLYVSGKLPTYRSPKPTFCPKWKISVNVGLGEGYVDNFPEKYNDLAFLVIQGNHSFGFPRNLSTLNDFSCHQITTKTFLLSKSINGW